MDIHDRPFAALTLNDGHAVIARFQLPFSEIRFGMNVAGNVDRQFVLNVMHWLSGAL